MNPPAEVLLERAVGWRQGVIAELKPVPRGLADVPVPGWAAVAEPFTAGGTSGGAALESEHARQAAVAEALERHAAARCVLEAAPLSTERWELSEFSMHSAEQRGRPDFPYSAGYSAPIYTSAWTLPGNIEVAVPAGLVGLKPEFGLPTTSSGLAAAASTTTALLRATQELVERDAFTVSWLHGVAPARVPIPPELADPVRRLGGSLVAFDLTPVYSPHPVIGVAGTLGLGGRARATLGLACRADPGAALRKAWLEWCQGTVFLRVWLSANGERTLSAEEVTDFDAHAAFYTANPHSWTRLPWWLGDEVATPPSSRAAGTTDANELDELVSAVRHGGIRLAYRELTTPEPAAVGLRVVRVLSPELAPLHSDHRWPFLGGTTSELSLRYPHAVPRCAFPSPWPHPLG